jgi:hypothetical protein
MFGPAIRQSVGEFERRFEPNGEEYLFRARATTAPVRLSQPEMRDCVSSFRRGMKRIMIGIFLSIASLIVIPVLAFPARSTTNVELYGGTSAIVAVFLFALWRLWNSPARKFAHRAPAGLPLTKHEARARNLASIKWSNLVLVSIGVTIWLSLQIFDVDATSNQKLLWSLLAFVFFVLIAVQSFRKWRYQSKA